jgi:hypothetical protein
MNLSDMTPAQFFALTCKTRGRISRSENPPSAPKRTLRDFRHADIGTTLDIYTHAINRDKLVAENQVMEAMIPCLSL